MMTREDNIKKARAAIEESEARGLDFIIIVFDGIEIPCLREIAENLDLEAGQEVDTVKALSAMRAHDLYHRLNNKR